MAKKTKQINKKEENQNFDLAGNMELGEKLLATENQNHNAKKEALGPNIKR